MAVAWASLTRWREDGGASKLTFVCRMVRFAYIAEWKFWRKKCRRGAWVSDDIDQLMDNSHSGTEMPRRFQIPADVEDPGEQLDAARARAGSGLEAAILQLSAREQLIVRRVGEAECLSSIARDMGISRERVRQLKARALNKMRRTLAQAEFQQKIKLARPISVAI